MSYRCIYIQAHSIFFDPQLKYKYLSVFFDSHDNDCGSSCIAVETINPKILHYYSINNPTFLSSFLILLMQLYVLLV